MTLRLRLVLSLVGLLTAGLLVFGVATYTLYARSQYERLDDQLRGSSGAVAAQLYAAARGESFPFPGGGDRDNDGRREPPVALPEATYAQLRASDGTILSQVQLASDSEVPDLSGISGASVEGDHHPGDEEFFDTGSVSGSTRWRVRVGPAAGGGGAQVVSAVPLDSVTDSLQRLVAIELVAGVSLLVLMAGGAWLILRAGLHPLEHMATSARSITAGDLSQRVEPAESKTEVGQLGLALNTMLGEIEVAFQERDATEARLRQFLADASHELRTPLTSIQGFAELFRVGGDDAALELSVILRRIEEEAARMGVLVEDLLLLARLDQTRPIERKPVDLAVLAADACSDAVAVDPERRLALDAPEPAVVMGDEGHLRQAIANLVTNAVRHTPDGSPLEVTVHVADGRVTLSVRDHGGGLDEDTLAHAFDRFWQADEARVGHGVGLGLSIVAAIADEHDGTVSAANAPDGGAVFTLAIPLTRPVAGPADPNGIQRIG